VSKQLVRLSASIEDVQKKALLMYASQNDLKNQFGEPGLNLALREILDTHPVLEVIIRMQRKKN